MLGCKPMFMPKRKIQDLVDELLDEISKKDISDRLSAATVLRKEVITLSIILEAWRVWVADVTFLELLSLEDLGKMIKDFSNILEVISSPSGYFSDVVEEFDKCDTCNHQTENSSEEIRVV